MAKDQITPIRREVILALADCGMRPTSVAKKLYIDHSTVRYHIRIIKAITGLDPMDFYDLGDLVASVKGVSKDDYLL